MARGVPEYIRRAVAADARPKRGRCSRCHAKMARVSPVDGFTDCGSCGATTRPRKPAAKPVALLTDAEVQARLM